MRRQAGYDTAARRDAMKSDATEARAADEALGSSWLESKAICAPNPSPTRPPSLPRSREPAFIGKRPDLEAATAH